MNPIPQPKLSTWVRRLVIATIVVLALAIVIRLTGIRLIGRPPAQTAATTTLLVVRDSEKAGDFKSAITQLTALLKQTMTRDEAHSAHLLLGTAYLATKDYKSALAQYQAAGGLEDSLSYSVAIGIGQSAELSGDHETAHHYYIKAAALAPADSSFDLEAAIKRTAQ